MSTLRDLALKLGGQLYAKLRESLEEEWDELGEVEKKAARESLEDMAGLYLRSLAGEDVKREIAHTKAQIANWKYVGSERVRSAISEALGQFAVWSGKLILKMLL